MRRTWCLRCRRQVRLHQTTLLPTPCGFPDRRLPGTAQPQARSTKPSRRTPDVNREIVRHRFLDPDASAEVIAQKIRQTGLDISTRSVTRVLDDFGLQKKLFAYRPNGPETVEAHASKKQRQQRPSDPKAIEMGVRQALADKVSGNLVGLWLLIPEHLRLGTWDLLCNWCGQPGDCVWPRLALQLVHESALCLTGLRDARSLRQRGFELANGLPFVASDISIHQLLNSHTVEEAKCLQIALGRRRLQLGHFKGRLLVVDPHRIVSFSKRQMRRHKKGQQAPAKMAQTFFGIDGDTKQPVGFVSGTSARTVSKATPELLEVAAAVFGPQAEKVLVAADAEHFTAELVDKIHQDKRFEILVPAPKTAKLQRRMQAIKEEEFKRHWAGFATAKQAYKMTNSESGPHWLFVQRTGERSQDYKYKGFLATQDSEVVEALTEDYPKRWHAEEFFNSEQDLGWDRAGTTNLHIRYGHMTMALLAQAAVYQLRQRLGEPESGWDSRGIAQKLLAGLEGDIRVIADTIVVTFYNAPNAARLQQHYQDLPAKLVAEGIDPHIPWLYGFKLDFRFN